MQFPNRSDSDIRSDTNKQDTQGELHAKLLRLRSQNPADHTPAGGRRKACGAWPGFETTRRAKLAAQADHLQALRIRIGNEHPDR